MLHTHTPESFADVLVLAEKADILNFDRQSARLSLVLDDHGADRRTCIDVLIEANRADVRTLRDYDPVKERWGEYCSPSGLEVFGSKKGRKALTDWLAARATEVTGYPNPASFSLYKKPSARN